MSAWVTLLAAAVGGVIAIAGQYVTKRNETATRRVELILEQCSQLVALSEDFHNRLWEEQVLGQPDRVAGWDVEGFRLAGARLRILCGDGDVLAALDELKASGKALGSYWRRHRVDDDEFGRRYQRSKVAVEGFAAASARLVRPYLGRR
jgi:hypothetical protein